MPPAAERDNPSTPDHPGSTASPDLLRTLLARSTLRPLHLAGRELLPIVQGGMGVGISAHRLAGSVAALGAMGTISSVDLRRHHPDLMERTRDCRVGEEAKAAINAANLEALEREIRAARVLCQGTAGPPQGSLTPSGDEAGHGTVLRTVPCLPNPSGLQAARWNGTGPARTWGRSESRGLLAVNVMRAVGEYAPSVTRALQAGIDAVVVGAGLPLDLPDLARDHPQAALVPILSDARGVALVVKKWERKQRLPDAIVIEHPRWAGGHLGAAKVADLADPRFDFDNVIPQALAFLRSAGVERQVPLIAAGGIRTFEDIARLQALGAAAVQLGTPFVATQECDAHPVFKQVLAEARDEDLVEFTSVAGLPARAVRTPWLRNYLAAEPRLQATAHKKPRCTLAFDCLAQCGLRDGLPGWGQFCIDTQLAAGLRGDLKKGLFFRGVGALPFGSRIVTVQALLERLLTPGMPPAAAAARAPVIPIAVEPQ
jgi:nitronate monooxygenase